MTEAIEIPQFIGRSYLTYDNRDILKRLVMKEMRDQTSSNTVAVYIQGLLCLVFRVSGSRTSLFMRFKSTAKDGLLLWRGDSPMRPNSDFLSMGLQDGALIFRYLV